MYFNWLETDCGLSLLAGEHWIQKHSGKNRAMKMPRQKQHEEHYKHLPCKDKNIHWSFLCAEINRSSPKAKLELGAKIDW